MLIRIGFGLVLCFCMAQSVTAQSDLATMCESWNQCNAKMTEKFEALDGGDMTPGLADEYRDLVDEANELIKSMREQGIKELQEKPGDAQVIRALLGIMVHDAQSDRDAMVLDVGQALIDAKVNPKYFEVAASVDRLELSQKQIFEELVIRHAESVADDLPRVKLNTSAGEIVLELFENEAPNTVRNFVSLIESGYYSNKLFHRVIEDFMAQGGGFETEGIGSGGPGYQIECECREADARQNFPGTISMAHAGRDTGGSQFFLNFKHNKHLDGKHTVFGRIVSGMEVLEKIDRTELKINGPERPIEQAKPDKIVTAEVVRKRDHSYRVRKKGEPELPEEPVAKLEDKKAKAETELDSESEKEDAPTLEVDEEDAAESEMKEEAPESEAKEESSDDKKTAGEEAKADAEKTEKSEAEAGESEVKKAEAETEEVEKPDTEEAGGSDAESDDDKDKS